MTVLNTANAIRLGAQTVSAVYAGATKVWPPALTVIDRFADVSGTPLTSHVSDDGGSWTSAISGTALVISDAGRVRKTGTAATNIAYHTPAHAVDAKIEFDLLVKSIITTPANAIGIYLRHPGTASDTGYLFDFLVNPSGTARQFRLLRLLTGSVAETIGSYSIGTPADGTTFRVRCEVRNGFQQLSVDGVPRITGASTALNGAGRIAIRAGGAVATTDTTGLHMDNLAMVV